MSWYVRTQTGWGLRGILMGAFVFLLYRARLRAGSWNGISESSEFWPLLAAGIILALAVLVFTVMTVTVDEGDIEISMGLELIRKRIAIPEIASIGKVVIPWHSVGFKKVSGGWLYSVAVSGGVDIVMKNGKRFIIGSDDSEGLAQAISMRMAGVRE
ncbi:MAG: hypothetical protein Q7I97_00750 [Thermovirgaceae bacterium]|nr:hypothetical protein [Thermovirgaceae bacterium]